MEFDSTLPSTFMDRDLGSESLFQCSNRGSNIRIIRLLFSHPMEVQRTAEQYMAMVREAGFRFGPENTSFPYLWWSRSDLGAAEFWGFGVPRPGEREETLINLVATKA